MFQKNFWTDINEHNPKPSWIVQQRHPVRDVWALFWLGCSREIDIFQTFIFTTASKGGRLHLSISDSAQQFFMFVVFFSFFNVSFFFLLGSPSIPAWILYDHPQDMLPVFKLIFQNSNLFSSCGWSNNIKAGILGPPNCKKTKY